MYHKKKSLLGYLGLFFVPLFILLLATFSISFASEPLYNQSRQDTFFGKYTMQNIVDELELDEIYSGDALESLTYWANQFMTSFNNSSGDLTLQDLVIQKGSNNALYLYIANNTADGGQDRSYLYIENVQLYAQMKFTYLDRWVYSGQNISYPITKGMAGNIFKIDSSSWSAGGTQRYYVDTYTDSSIYLSDSITFIPTYAVAGYTQSYGYGWYFLNHTVDVEIAPTPTPVPTATPNASGDYSQQLDNIEYTLLGTKDEVHNFRVDVNQGLEEIKEAIPTSGEIKDAQIEAETDFWGESGDISGDEMGEQASGEISALINEMSGDLAENSAFLALGAFEEGLLNLLSERDTSKLDFVVSWGNIFTSSGFLDGSIINTTLPSGDSTLIISGDSINFSALCRNNETLSDIQFYIRVIFNFFMALNILSYIYNLTLSTLGIDNPYLYENPESQHEDIVLNANDGSMTSYRHTRNPWSRVRNTTIVYTKRR